MQETAFRNRIIDFLIGHIEEVKISGEVLKEMESATL